MPGDLLQLLFGRGQRRAREHHAGGGAHGGDLGEGRGALRLVDRQCQGAAHPDIVERFPPLVRGDQIAAIPVALLDGDLLAQILDQLVARRRRHAAELQRGPVAADRVDAGGLLGRVDCGEAVEIGQALAVVIGVAGAGDRLAGLVADEFERAGAEDVLLVPVLVLVEDRLLVDVGERVGEARQESRGRVFEPEDDGLRVRRLNLVDHREIGLAGAGDTLRRADDAAPARHHVGRAQRRAVVKLHPVAQCEGVGLALLGRLWHFGAQIADKVGGRGRVFRVDPHQDAVKRRGDMHHRECRLAVSVEARRRIGRDHVGQRAARFRDLGREGWPALAAQDKGERETAGEYAAYHPLVTPGQGAAEGAIAPGCRQPNGPDAIHATRAAIVCIPRPRSGSADERRNPAAG